MSCPHPSRTWQRPAAQNQEAATSPPSKLWESPAQSRGAPVLLITGRSPKLPVREIGAQNSALVSRRTVAIGRFQPGGHLAPQPPVWLRQQGRVAAPTPRAQHGAVPAPPRPPLTSPCARSLREADR